MNSGCHSTDIGESFSGAFADASPIERERLVFDLLQAEIASILSLSPPPAFNPRATFKELGLGSLMCVLLAGHLNERLRGFCQLSPTAVIDYPTIETLSEHILEHSKEVGRDA